MEEKYGPKGNLMPRDIVSREIYNLGKEVFLDVSFLDENKIRQRIPEVRGLCSKYIGLDICKDPIPVAPSVHFFMGGLAVRNNHETNIRNLFAPCESCAVMRKARKESRGAHYRSDYPPKLQRRMPPPPSYRMMAESIMRGWTRRQYYES